MKGTKDLKELGREQELAFRVGMKTDEQYNDECMVCLNVNSYEVTTGGIQQQKE
jgi:hypothetical protein